MLYYFSDIICSKFTNSHSEFHKFIRLQILADAVYVDVLY